MVYGPQVHWHRYFEHASLFGRCILPVLLLQGRQHGRCQKVRYRTGVLPACLRYAGHRHCDAHVFHCAEGHCSSADVVCVHVFLQLAVPSGEYGLETVFHLGVHRAVFGIQRQAVVGDALSVTPVDVLSSQGEEETHCTESVRERVENVKEYLFPAGAYAVEEAVLIGIIKSFERLHGTNLRVFLYPVEVPPERTGLELAAEGGYALGCLEKGLLEDIGVDIFSESQFHPVERAVVLAHGRGIYICGIVQPEFFRD